MKHTEIIERIEKVAPLLGASSWDKCGVQVASFVSLCNHVAVMLDPSLEQVTRALEAGADFILSHHPFSMQPRYPDVADEYLATLSLLLQKKAWLYSAHTSLDANPAGPVQWLAEALCLQHVQVLEPRVKDAQGADLGFGFIGKLPEPCSYGSFTGLLGACLKRNQWQGCGPVPEMVHTVACCPGSGSGLALQAQLLGADVLITGDVKYHAALDARMRILDVSHFALEEEMMRRFAVHLSSVLSVPVTFFAATDPLEFERSGI